MNAAAIKKRTVSISTKRQFTIPQIFYTMLGFSDKAECEVRGEELIIRPAIEKTGGEFAEQILEELVAKGLTGEKLIDEFKKRQSEVRPAVQAMLLEAEKAANGEAESASMSDVFGEDNVNG